MSKLDILNEQIDKLKTQLSELIDQRDSAQEIVNSARDTYVKHYVAVDDDYATYIFYVNDVVDATDDTIRINGRMLVMYKNSRKFRSGVCIGNTIANIKSAKILDYPDVIEECNKYIDTVKGYLYDMVNKLSTASISTTSVESDVATIEKWMTNPTAELDKFAAEENLI